MENYCKDSLKHDTKNRTSCIYLLERQIFGEKWLFKRRNVACMCKKQYNSYQQGKAALTQ